ncbi:ankyrin repeat-containing protein [Legionella quinlivanii]|uniref:Ankyrin repeat-containing protein n=1 Tax=Legionella quinlivanii TaxID=45073 RepID=A0A0W0Y7Q1_9GAMM|nr:YopT-type cysteine protease domain-containing protein [Legionella quinlivanii]KTD52655.1 ankyrin repeat-containing protein [Legionella quinlivanii]SEG25358.1 virulence surface antigen [Legionella quinlivanii DSM 21216]STY10335.1 ankyrin repeat-containing protein [Legionella quinlivanii]
MSTDINQGRIIDVLNKYLKANNFPFKMNRTGICNGLAIVHAKYVLEGRNQEFENILKYISEGKRDNNITDEDINNFAFQTLLAFAPHEFDNKLHQVTAMQALKIKGIPLSPSFSFCMAASRGNWIQALQDIALKDDEVMIVASINHAISIHKVNGNYIVYDPNYSNGFKKFADETSLIKELYSNVFHYSKGNLGLEIQILRHPEKQNEERVFPQVESLYQKYLPDPNLIAECDGQLFKTLPAAAAHNDKSVIEYLKRRGANGYTEAAMAAVKSNNTSALEALLAHIDKESQRLIIWDYAFSLGRKDIIGILKENITFKTSYEEYISTHVFLSAIASGKNATLLAELIEDYRAVSLEKMQKSFVRRKEELEVQFSPEELVRYIQSMPDKVDSELSELILGQSRYSSSKNPSPMSNAISSGDVQSVRRLMEQLHSSGTELTDEQKIGYLLEAIRANRNSVTNYLISEEPGIARELMKTINLSLYAVEHTNIMLLRDLQKHGVEFSPTAQKIIDRKEHKEFTVIESLGIGILKFADFLKDIFVNNVSYSKIKGVNYDCKLFKSIKEELQSVKQTDELDDIPVEVLDLDSLGSVTVA